MPTPTPEYLVTAFRHFAGFCQGVAPLYVELSERLASSPEVAALALHASDRQPPVNLLFGAVHYLLLDGVDHPLADYYPSVGGTRPAHDAWPPFVDFCTEHEDTIVAMIASRRVQTNEVGRCGLLLPAFAAAHEAFARPLFLIELGASAGLNLFFDSFHYDYGDAGTVGATRSVVIRTEVRGDVPIPRSVPPVAGRTGIDLAPADVTNDDSMRWIEALIWADEVDRIEQQRGARRIARRNPPLIHQGDGLHVTPDVIASVAGDALPCVFHSHTIYQMSKEWRTAFDAMLDDVGRTRDLASISLEWLGDEPGPQLHASHWQDGQRTNTHRASCHHHGRWIDRVPGPTAIC